MRLVFAFLLAAWACVLPAAFNGASALVPIAAPKTQKLAHDAKFSCGMTDEGFKCRSEPGTTGHGKMRKIPGASSGDSSAAPEPPAGGSEDALPSAPGDWGTSTSTQAPPPAAPPASCPANTELLGGHCIPYTQRCTNAIPPNAYPPQCRGEEKQVCNFHPDGSKDCCCRTYSKY